jgi:hypothetical protein
MSAVVPPSERVCERCGRKDVWSEAKQKWVVAEEDGERQTGTAHCLHEWDINGTYNPFPDAE